MFDAPVDEDRTAVAGPRRSRVVALVAICAAFVLGTTALAVVATGSEAGPVGTSGAPGPPGAGSPATGIVVQVAGAVMRPGVYRFGTGARVADAIEAAGGYGPRVDAERAERELDLAAKLVDGRTIRVPSRDGSSASDDPGRGPVPTSGVVLVDVNHATLAELDALPGIGPVTAQKIVEARRARPFASADELRSRGLLGEKAYERIKDLVTAR